MQRLNRAFAYFFKKRVMKEKRGKFVHDLKKLIILEFFGG